MVANVLLEGPEREKLLKSNLAQLSIPLAEIGSFAVWPAVGGKRSVPAYFIVTMQNSSTKYHVLRKFRRIEKAVLGAIQARISTQIEVRDELQ